MTGYEAQPRGSPGAGPPPVYVSVSGHQEKALFMLVIATPTKTGHQNKKNNKPKIPQVPEGDSVGVRHTLLILHTAVAVTTRLTPFSSFGANDS